MCLISCCITSLEVILKCLKLNSNLKTHLFTHVKYLIIIYELSFVASDAPHACPLLAATGEDSIIITDTTTDTSDRNETCVVVNSSFSFEVSL